MKLKKIMKCDRISMINLIFGGRSADGSALVSGTKGRWFKSSRPDHRLKVSSYTNKKRLFFLSMSK